MTKIASSWYRRGLYSQVTIALLLFAPGFALYLTFEADESTARATLDAYYERWIDLLSNRDALSAEELSDESAALVDGLFYLDSLAPRILANEWKSLGSRDQDAFVEALKVSINKIAFSYALADGDGLLPSLQLVKEEMGDDKAALEYSIRVGQDRRETLEIWMVKSLEGEWKISDLKFDDEGMVDYYRDFSSKLIRDYSFPYLIAKLGDYPFVVLEDFEASAVGELPVGWLWRETDDKKNKPYAVRREGGNNYLEATDNGESVILGKDVKWDLREYPYVSFRWRVHRIPEGADERFDKKVDSAAGVYFIYRRTLGLIPESVKYVWSSTLPVGSAVQREGVGKPWMVVASTGTDQLGEWRTYVFDLRAAYRETFGGKPPDKPVGIGILSDANSMNSQAYADYDDIRVLRSADDAVTSGVEQILKANKR